MTEEEIKRYKELEKRIEILELELKYFKKMYNECNNFFFQNTGDHIPRID